MAVYLAMAIQGSIVFGLHSLLDTLYLEATMGWSSRDTRVAVAIFFIGGLMISQGELLPIPANADELLLHGTSVHGAVKVVTDVV